MKQEVDHFVAASHGTCTLYIIHNHVNQMMVEDDHAEIVPDALKQYFEQVRRDMEADTAEPGCVLCGKALDGAAPGAIAVCIPLRFFGETLGMPICCACTGAVSRDDLRQQLVQRLREEGINALAPRD